MTSILNMLQFSDRASAFAALSNYSVNYGGRSVPLVGPTQTGQAFNASIVDAGGQGDPGIPIMASGALKPGYFLNVMSDSLDANMPGLTAAADSVDTKSDVAHLVFGTAPSTPQRVFA